MPESLYIDEVAVNVRLVRWARYVSGGMSGSFLGLPNRTPYLELAIKCTANNHSIPEDVWHTDRLVRALAEFDADLKTVIEMAYLGQGSKRQQAEQLGMTDAKFRRLFCRATQQLIALFNEAR